MAALMMTFVVSLVELSVPVVQRSHGKAGLAFVIHLQVLEKSLNKEIKSPKVVL